MPQDSEDVSQDSLEKVLRYAQDKPQLDTEDIIGILATTTTRLVINRHRDNFRRKKREVDIFDLESTQYENVSQGERPTELEAIETVFEEEKVAQLRDLLVEMTDFIDTISTRSYAQYKVFKSLLTNTEGKLNKELAKEIGMTEFQFKAALHRLRDDLNERFGRKFHALVD